MLINDGTPKRSHAVQDYYLNLGETLTMRGNGCLIQVTATSGNRFQVNICTDRDKQIDLTINGDTKR